MLTFTPVVPFDRTAFLKGFAKLGFFDTVSVHANSRRIVWVLGRTLLGPDKATDVMPRRVEWIGIVRVPRSTPEIVQIVMWRTISSRATIIGRDPRSEARTGAMARLPASRRRELVREEIRTWPWRRSKVGESRKGTPVFTWRPRTVG